MAKTATRSSILTDMKYLGKEPEFSGNVLSTSEYIKTLNWYNYFKNVDDAKQYIIEYCKENKIKINISNHTTNTFGWIARMTQRGAKLPAEALTKLDAYLQTLKKREVKVEDAVAKVEEKETRKVSVWLADIEEIVDINDGTFDAYKYLSTNSVPQMYVKQIAEFYQPQYDEVKAAYEKEDKELVEAFSNHKRMELKRLMLLLGSIIEDCGKFLGNTKKQRRPRAKKTKTTDSLMKHFKYLKEDTTLKISSEDPSKIIGAQAVYVLNTKYNVFTVFTANSEKGLTISRTSIDGYDPKNSKSKRVGRKIQDVIKMVTEGTKASRKKIMGNLKQEEIRFTDRLNEATVILKVDK